MSQHTKTLSVYRNWQKKLVEWKADLSHLIYPNTCLICSAETSNKKIKMSNDIRYLTPINIDIKKDKYCRFKKSGIKFIDYKDPNFLLKLINEQGKILPRRITGTSQKFQTRVNKAIKRARHLAILPYVGDMLK
jgi:small subunit ribosomal protein S18